MSLSNGNADLRGLDVAAASADTNPWVSHQLRLYRTTGGSRDCSRATDGLHGNRRGGKGWWRGEGFCAMEGGMVNNMNWGKARLYVYTGMLGLLRKDTL